ncbi:MAG: TPM domain-containing protein [Akkermansiaceae bacterium]
MIACPRCKTPLKETSTECLGCQLDLDKVAKELGLVPVIFGGVSDSPEVFTPADEKKLKKMVLKHQRDFPQSRLHIVTRSFPQKVELPTLIFWLFNRAGLSQESEKQGQNRDIVILIEPLRKEAAIMIGYGLEPFVPQSDLDQILASAQPAFAAGNIMNGIESVVGSLSDLLKRVSRELTLSFGTKTVYVTEAEANDF